MAFSKLSVDLKGMAETCLCLLGVKVSLCGDVAVKVEYEGDTPPLTGAVAVAAPMIDLASRLAA